MASNVSMWLSVVIFLITYVFIVSEKFDRAVVSQIGAFFMILLKIIDQKSAFLGVDFNTLGLLIGMMILVMIICSASLTMNKFMY